RSPDFLAGGRVVRVDDARVVAGIRLALPARDDLSVGDDGTGAGASALLRLHHCRFPPQVAGVHIHGVDLVVGAAVDQRTAPHRDSAVGAAVHAFGQFAPMLPDQVAGL